MKKILEFPDPLRLIDERSIAFRAAVASAPSLDVQVPTCPEWTLFDLVQHLGEGRRKWAAIVAAGPADAPPARSAWAAPAAPWEREALLDWWAASAQQLLDALRESGPDRDCWTWWDASQSPQTAGAAARHQLQEMATHTYDAQITAGARQPLPEEVALDGVDECLAARARRRRLLRHRGRLLAPHSLRRRRTDRPPPRTRRNARHRCRRGPGRGRRLPPGHSR